MAKAKKAKPKVAPKKAKGKAHPGRKARAEPPRDEERERRITMEIVVDCYNEEEQAMGWYCYLEEKLGDGFTARCVEEREVSPLSVGDEMEVVGMAQERECRGEMFVAIDWDGRTLAVPLSQLEVVEAENEAREAVEDWHYWVGRGNTL